jgi:hypothetical protein
MQFSIEKLFEMIEARFGKGAATVLLLLFYVAAAVFFLGLIWDSFARLESSVMHLLSGRPLPSVDRTLRVLSLLLTGLVLWLTFQQLTTSKRAVKELTYVIQGAVIEMEGLAQRIGVLELSTVTSPKDS